MNCFLGWIITTCFIRINWHVVISQWFSMPEDWKIKQKLISRKRGQNPLFLFQEKEFTACRFSGAGFPLAVMVKQSCSQQQFFPIHLYRRDECIFQQLGITEHQGPGSTTVVLLFFWQLSTNNNEFFYTSGSCFVAVAVLLQFDTIGKGWHIRLLWSLRSLSFQQTSDKQDAVKGVFNVF